MTLLFTAALIFLPDIGLWSLYKEKHLVKPPEAAEPQVGAKPPGSTAPRRAEGGSRPSGHGPGSRPLRGCGAPAPAEGAERSGSGSTCACPTAAPERESCGSI